MTIAFVKNGGVLSTKTAGTSFSVTVPAGGHAIGNTIFLFLVNQNANLIPTNPVGDSRGNTWTVFAAPGVNHSGAIVYSTLTTALQAGDLISWTWNGSVSLCLGLTVEFSGVSLVTDGSNHVSATSTTNPSITAFSTTNAQDLLVALVTTNGPSGDGYGEDTTARCGANWITLPRQGTTGGSATSNSTLNAAYLITTTTGLVNYQPTLGTARNNGDTVLAFQGAAAPATLLPQFHHRHAPAVMARSSSGRF